MHRRQFLFNSAIAASALTLLGTKWSFASSMAKSSYQFTPLRNNVGIFTEQGGTIAWLANKEGIAVVDAEFPEQAAHLIAELKNHSHQPFKWLINTHHHGDHTSGNIAFKGLVKNVAAHVNSLANQTAVAKKRQTEDKQLYPNVTFDKSWKTKVGNERIQAHYFGAGHTNGDSMIHFEHANIVHMGDLVFNRLYPYVDRSAGASVKNWALVLEKAQKHFDKDTLFIFGHAADTEKVTGTKDDLKAMQTYLEKLADYVQSSIKAGKTKEEIIKVKSIPSISNWHGDGIEYGITAAYEEFSIQH